MERTDGGDFCMMFMLEEIAKLGEDLKLSLRGISDLCVEKEGTTINPAIVGGLTRLLADSARRIQDKASYGLEMLYKDEGVA